MYAGDPGLGGVCHRKGLSRDTRLSHGLVYPSTGPLLNMVYTYTIYIMVSRLHADGTCNATSNKVIVDPAIFATSLASNIFH